MLVQMAAVALLAVMPVLNFKQIHIAGSGVWPPAAC